MTRPDMTTQASLTHLPFVECPQCGRLTLWMIAHTCRPLSPIIEEILNQGAQP